MSTKILENKFNLKDDLAFDFYQGIKAPCDFKIGAELERINVLKDTFEAVPYVIVEQFLDIFGAKYGWQKIKNSGNHTLGLQKEGHFVFLEPGSQIELSLAKADNIHKIADFTADFNKKSSEVAEFLGFYTLGYGIQPLSVFDRISVIPKERYELMTDYFFDKGAMAYVMMRETAGTQVTLDYSSEEDAILKLRLGMFLAPVVSAMFSNSPIHAGQKTNYKSFRAKSWLYTDDDRCGFIDNKLLNPREEFTFGDYVETLLDVPMIFAMRENKPFQVNKTFREYLLNGHEGLRATMDDWRLHANLFFPEVRLKGFLEFRNADAQKPDMNLAIMALYKGIFYDEEALNKAYSLFSEFSPFDFRRMRFLAPQYALNVEVQGRRILDIAVQLIQIAQNSLQKQAALNESCQDESIYLSVLENFIREGQTPSDKLLEICGDDIGKIAKYTKLSSSLQD